MKRLAIFLAVIMTACSGGDFIQSRVEHFVRSTYPDVDRVFTAHVDTVTYGDNLDYRIERAKHDVEFAAMMVRDYGGDAAEASLAKANAWAAALDSLKGITAPYLLSAVAAYNCTVSYNRPDNLVWVQLDGDGNLLNITKEPEKVLLNPGSDIEGYFKVWEKYHQ